MPNPTKRFKETFLHIGPHKTGSSAIQAACDENREALARCGILYPLGRWHGQLGSFFSEEKVTFIYNLHAGKNDEKEIIKSDAAYLVDIRNQFLTSACDRLVLSYEGFVDLDEPSLKRLRDFLLQFSDEITIVAYCRHPLSFAPSEISQRVRMGLRSGFDDRADLPIPAFRDYFEKFGHVFGLAQLRLRVFSRSELRNGDVRPDFLHTIGLSPVQLDTINLPQAPENKSLSVEAIMLGDALARYAPLANRSNIFPLQYDHILSAIKGRSLELTSEQRAEIMRLSEPHLDYLDKIFGIRVADPTQDERSRRGRIRVVLAMKQSGALLNIYLETVSSTKHIVGFWDVIPNPRRSFTAI